MGIPDARCILARHKRLGSDSDLAWRSALAVPDDPLDRRTLAWARAEFEAAYHGVGSPHQHAAEALALMRGVAGRPPGRC